MKENKVRPSEFAKLVGVSAVTVQNWIKGGRIEATRIGDRFFIDPAEVHKVVTTDNRR